MDSNTLRPISKIFNQAIYRIPDYQRGYAWTEKQVKEFLSDILQIETGKSHYAGVLTVEKLDRRAYKNWEDDLWIIDGKNFTPYHVVDGQQRLTTTVILIECICEIAKSKKISTLNFDTIEEIRKQYVYDSHKDAISRSYIFGYEKDNPSYEFLKIKIFGEDSPSGYSDERTIYTSNLQRAKDIFTNYLEKLDQDNIEDIYRKTTQSLMFNTYVMESEIDVFVSFETMNNRGVQLSNLELLKNRLIYLSTRYSNLSDNDRQSLRKIVNDSWRSIYHYLGKNENNPLIDDTFLYVHTQMYFFDSNLDMRYRQLNRAGRTGQIQISQEIGAALLDDVFSTRDNPENDAPRKKRIPAKAVKKYAENISNAVVIWFDLNNPTMSSSFTDSEKIWADKVRRNSFAMEVFAATLMKFYLLKPSKAQSLKMLKAVERCGFLLSLSRQYEARRYIKEMYILAKKLDDAQKLIDLIIEVNEKIVKLGKEDWYGLERLGDYRGYYMWEGLRYFMYEYELSLEAETKIQKHKIDWDQYVSGFATSSTVEHILPQTASDDYWVGHFKGYSPRQQRSLRDSLGNLLPLSRPRNSSLQNASFTHKCDNDTKICYKYGSLSEIEVTKQSDWTAQTILERGIRLLEFMENRWKLNLGDNKQKKELLGLDFLTDTDIAER